MSSRYNFQNPMDGSLDKSNSSSSTMKRLSGTPSEGTIAKTIGAGDNAKNSIIWISIRWSFILGALTTFAVYLRPVYCQADYPGSLIEDMKSVWGVFVPIITLALGYIFGKGR